MIVTSETCIVCGGNHGVRTLHPNTVATAIIDRVNTSDSIGLSFQPGMSRDEVMARLIAAAPRLLSDEFRFRGDEIHGPRRPD